MHLGLTAVVLAGALAFAATQARAQEDESVCDRYVKPSASADTSPPWHVARACLRELRTGDAGALRAFVLRLFAAPDVRFYTSDRPQGLPFAAVMSSNGAVVRAFDRVAQINPSGQPYNGMGHTGLGMMLYGLADRAQRQGMEADARLYRTLARAAFNTALRPKGENGLSETAPCERDRPQSCTWFYSVTKRDAATGTGATLNQHLHMVRDLGKAADIVRRNRWESGDDYEQAFRAGLNQLFLSDGHVRKGRPPNLADFIPPGSDRASHAWAFYGFNPTQEPPGGGYHLNRSGKDCHYHFHDLQLLEEILVRATRGERPASLDAVLRSCTSSLRSLYGPARLWVEGALTPNPKLPGSERDKTCQTLPKKTDGWLSGTEIAKLYARCNRQQDP